MKRWILTTGLLLLLCVSSWAAQTTNWVIHGTLTTLLTPNAIATNGYTAASAAYDNTIGSTGSGYTLCQFEAVLNFSSPPNNNSAVYIWLLRSIDNGSTFQDTPTATVITGPPQLSIPIPSGQAAGATTIRAIGEVRCPPGQFKIAAQLSNTGQTTTGTNTIKLLQYTPQTN